jgi:uncharacterized protein YdcH (DUF465 family)
MSYKQTSHDLIVHLNNLTQKLNRVPSRREFIDSLVGGKYLLEKHFASFSKLLANSNVVQAAIVETDKAETKIVQKELLLKKYSKLCLKKELLSGFVLHRLNLADMFERAGNPPVLRGSFEPDTHIKYVDESAFTSYVKFLGYYQPHFRMIGGDFVDCEGVSHWKPNELNPRRLVEEMKKARLYLQRLQDATPDASTLIYLEGNHEHWIQQAFLNMPELFDGLADLGIDVSLNSLLELEKFGYQLFPLNNIVQIGSANFTHGLRAGATHATKTLNLIKANIYYGHLHDYQAVSQPSINGTIEAASLGCLSRTDAVFLRGNPNNWTQGHCVFEFLPDGSFTRYFIPIKNGIATFNGLIFDGNK